VVNGDVGCEAYIAWGVGLSHERSDIAGAPFASGAVCFNGRATLGERWPFRLRATAALIRITWRDRRRDKTTARDFTWRRGPQTGRRGTAELGFVEGAVANEHLASAPIARDQLVIVVGPEHPWVGRPRLMPRDLMEGEWVLREPGSGTRSVFEEALRDLGAKPDALRIQLELPSNEAVRAAVEAGLGATAISSSVAAPSIEAGLLYQVAFRLPEREFHVLRRKDRYHSRVADALLALMTNRRRLPAVRREKQRRNEGNVRSSSR
jgi:DNA-binding transcriptional LysR family regulator